ncbi:hypothetical protein C2S51_020824 [Perilla frutescens var. frutescens]|nr:hypothetical protein C2S51_020824 [Perilla frutescens var. frutescens]
MSSSSNSSIMNKEKRQETLETNHHHDLIPNDDITTVILSGLPVKTLLKFRTVSKSWRDIIDSSSFSNLHLQNQLSNDNNNNHKTTFLQFICNDPCPYFSVFKLSVMHLDNRKSSYNDLPSYQDFFNNKIKEGIPGFAGPVHGLICLYKHGSGKPIALCNPSLKKIKILPKSNFPSIIRNVGFGYDDVERDYKVVQLSYKFPQSTVIDVQVYSWKKNTWRVLTDHPLDKHYLITQPIQSWSSGGAGAAVAHWYGKKWRGESINGGRDNFDFVIVSFDMRNEVFETIRIPCFQDSGKLMKGKVFAKEDSFVLFLWPLSKRYGDERLIMLEYKLVGKKRDWIKVGCIGPFDGIGRVLPEALWKSDGLVLKLYSRGNCREEVKIVLYDCCSGQIVRCFDEISMSKKDGCFRLVQYRGSLISP